MGQAGPFSGALTDRAHPLLVLADTAATDAADRLHDGAVQALVAARYAADLVVRGADPVLARDAVQEALVQLRTALWHLRPRASGEGGLGHALDLLRTQLLSEGRGPLLVDLDGAAADSASFAALAYRLVQAAALAPDAGSVQVVVRRRGAELALDLTGGAALADEGAWTAAVHALGGSLSTQDGPPRVVRLRVPALDPATEVAP